MDNVLRYDITSTVNAVYCYVNVLFLSFLDLMYILEQQWYAFHFTFITCMYICGVSYAIMLHQLTFFDTFNLSYHFSLNQNRSLEEMRSVCYDYKK